MIVFAVQNGPHHVIRFVHVSDAVVENGSAGWKRGSTWFKIIL